MPPITEIRMCIILTRQSTGSNLTFKETINVEGSVDKISIDCAVNRYLESKYPCWKLIKAEQL